MHEWVRDFPARFCFEKEHNLWTIGGYVDKKNICRALSFFGGSTHFIAKDGTTIIVRFAGKNFL